jgi:lauroyl/myristoyl acyltransferase
MVDAMEAMIRRYPAQWIWFQRPWKKTHPQLYPEWAARRRKHKQKKKSGTQRNRVGTE